MVLSLQEYTIHCKVVGNYIKTIWWLLLFITYSSTDDAIKYYLVSCGQTSFLKLGVIACSISAWPKKGLVWFAQASCSNTSMLTRGVDLLRSCFSPRLNKNPL